MDRERGIEITIKRERERERERAGERELYSCLSHKVKIYEQGPLNAFLLRSL